MLDYNITIGVILAVSGVRGLVKIRCFTKRPRDLEEFENIFDSDENKYKVEVVNVRKDCIIGKLEGVSSRDEARKLCNKMLMIKRSALPSVDEGEFYYADLLGSTVNLTENGQEVGVVKNVLNFGASDILEVYDHTSEQSLYYPLVKHYVPMIDSKAKKIFINKLVEEVVGPE